MFSPEHAHVGSDTAHTGTLPKKSVVLTHLELTIDGEKYYNTALNVCIAIHNVLQYIHLYMYCNSLCIAIHNEL